MYSSLSKIEKFKQKLESELLTHTFPSPTASMIKTKSKEPTKQVPQNSQRIILNAEPMEQQFNEAVVTAFDDRRQVNLTSKWPYCVHGVVAADFGDASGWGTGTLIGLNIVLTAGHNLYNRQSKTYANPETLQYLPGMNGQDLPFGIARVAKYLVSPNFVKYGTDDYGLLILEEPIGEMTGYFGLVCPKSGELTNKRINVTGYPGDKVREKPNMYEMWGMEGKANNIDHYRGLMDYIIDTGKGQSGSGVWYEENGDYYVCGVHVLGGQTVNTATLLTPKMYKQIHEWIYEAVPGEFLVGLGEKKELAFCDQKIDVDCMEALMKYNLDGLTILDLNYRKIGTEGIRVLAQNISWTHLAELHLDGNNIDLEGVKELAQNRHWTNLKYLSLCHNNIGSEGAIELAKNESWINLSVLSLGHNEIGALGVAELARNETWRNLTQLYLHKNDICAEGARELAQNESWMNLSRLYLHVNKIDKQGVIELAKNTSWINLSELHLNGNNLDKKDSIQILTNNSCWKNLSKNKIFI